jgi:hypothetical protein
MAPVLVTALAADAVKNRWAARPGSTTASDAYRIVARRT